MNINFEKSYVINNAQYSNTSYILTLPLEIVQKITLFMSTGTKIYFGQVSKICQKATLLSEQDTEAVKTAKLFFNLINNKASDRDTISALQFIVQNGFCSFDKAKNIADKIFVKNPRLNLRLTENIHVDIGRFYGRLGFEYFRQYDLPKAWLCLVEALNANASSKKASRLKKAMQITR